MHKLLRIVSVLALACAAMTAAWSAHAYRRNALELVAIAQKETKALERCNDSLTESTAWLSTANKNAETWRGLALLCQHGPVKDVALAQTADEDDPVQIVVGPGNDLHVTVPGMARKDLESVMASFFSRGDRAAKARFDKLFAEAGDLTLVLTSKSKTQLASAAQETY